MNLFMAEHEIVGHPSLKRSWTVRLLLHIRVHAAKVAHIFDLF